MSILLNKLSASSLLPGMQNIGTSETTATVNGTLVASGTLGGNLIGTFQVYFPRNDIISVMRVTLPDAHGDLAAYWFPVVGSVELYDATTGITLLLFVQSSASGRLVQFNMINNTTSDIAITNYRIQAFAHLYSYPF